MFDHPWDLQSIDFPIGKGCVAVEIGGYTGRWAKAIAEKYNPCLFVFEPQRWAYEICKKELSGFETAHVFNFGLGVENGRFPLYNFETDGASFVLENHARPTGDGRMVEIRRAFRSLGIQFVDLMLMNIEGYEFKLIPHMIHYGLMSKIRFFMCQFHTDDENEHLAIREEISKHMKLYFNYGKVLTCWEMN